MSAKLSIKFRGNKPNSRKDYSVMLTCKQEPEVFRWTDQSLADYRRAKTIRVITLCGLIAPLLQRA